MIEDVDPTPQMSRWPLRFGEFQSLRWAIEHWILLHVFRLRFCPSCAGYFDPLCMAQPDKCEWCYARDYCIGVDMALEAE